MLKSQRLQRQCSVHYQTIPFIWSISSSLLLCSCCYPGWATWLWLQIRWKNTFSKWWRPRMWRRCGSSMKAHHLNGERAIIRLTDLVSGETGFGICESKITCFMVNMAHWCKKSNLVFFILHIILFIHHFMSTYIIINNNFIIKYFWATSAKTPSCKTLILQLKILDMCFFISLSV